MGSGGVLSLQPRRESGSAPWRCDGEAEGTGGDAVRHGARWVGEAPRDSHLRRMQSSWHLSVRSGWHLSGLMAHILSPRHEIIHPQRRKSSGGPQSHVWATRTRGNEKLTAVWVVQSCECAVLYNGAPDCSRVIDFAKPAPMASFQVYLPPSTSFPLPFLSPHPLVTPGVSVN
jgi:hypothetical protein